MHYNEYATGRPYVPGKDKDRFRSKYLDIPNAPLYLFGFGLSYTTFAISEITMSRREISCEGSITALVLVKNTGLTAGIEVIQLYLRDLTASVVRPVKELKGFQKVWLKLAEETEVSFTITDQELRFYTAGGEVKREPGRFQVFIGNDSQTENMAEFELL